MAKDRYTRQGSDRSDPSSGQIPPQSMDRLSDDALAKLLLRQRREERTWWSHLMEWMRKNFRI